MNTQEIRDMIQNIALDVSIRAISNICTTLEALNETISKLEARLDKMEKYLDINHNEK